MIGAVETENRFRCSRARCTLDAQWRIEWRNPRIHASDRIKVWLACTEHRDYLRAFLEARSFPVAVLPLETAAG